MILIIPTGILHKRPAGETGGAKWEVEKVVDESEIVGVCVCARVCA